MDSVVIQAEAADDPPTELYVRTTPEGAKVFLDGKEVGVTPDLFKVEPGKAKIVVKLEGRDPVEREVEIHASKITRLELEFKNQASTTADNRNKTTDAKKVHLPDAATKDADVVLDLASDQLLKVPDLKKGPSQFTEMGKGDLVFGRGEMSCLRGGSIMIWHENRFVPYTPKKSDEDAKGYYISAPPCRLLIVTAEKKNYDVTILSVDQKGGIDLEYRPANAAIVPIDNPETVKDAQAARPDEAEIKYKQGIELAKNGRYEEAIASFQASLMLKPDYAEAHNDLGLALAEIGRLQEAIEHYQKALRLKPDYAEVHNNLGADLEKMGRIQEAVKLYRNAVELKPDYAEAKKNLAAVMDKLKQSEEPNGPRPSLSEKASDESAAAKPAPDEHNIIKNPAIESGDKAPDAPKVEPDSKVVEGVGWGAFRVGATREELVKALGPPDPNLNFGNKRVGWIARHHIDCIFDQNEHAVEIRFIEGYELPLASGVKIGSSEKEVLLAYGCAGPRCKPVVGEDARI